MNAPTADESNLSRITVNGRSSIPDVMYVTAIVIIIARYLMMNVPRESVVPDGWDNKYQIYTTVVARSVSIQKVGKSVRRKLANKGE